MRGVSGAGKNSFADFFKSAIICSADEYFTQENGNYKFIPEELREAHLQCKEKFVWALTFADLIIVANTNTKYSDFEFYLEEAKKMNYRTHVLVVENYHGNKNIHNVPEETLARQEQNIRNSLKLR